MCQGEPESEVYEGFGLFLVAVVLADTDYPIFLYQERTEDGDIIMGVAVPNDVRVVPKEAWEDVGLFSIVLGVLEEVYGADIVGFGELYGLTDFGEIVDNLIAIQTENPCFFGVGFNVISCLAERLFPFVISTDVRGVLAGDTHRFTVVGTSGITDVDGISTLYGFERTANKLHLVLGYDADRYRRFICH